MRNLLSVYRVELPPDGQLSIWPSRWTFPVRLGMALAQMVLEPLDLGDRPGSMQGTKQLIGLDLVRPVDWLCDRAALAAFNAHDQTTSVSSRIRSSFWTGG